ncbi:hypothetical protein L208DRAFT_1416092 [Tricholoma matsutake]|nr:hypothetical protein L208DRAFT_1416092 [Tricholoma matsutake 945]
MHITELEEGSRQISGHTQTFKVDKGGSSKAGNPMGIWGRVHLMCCTKWGEQKGLGFIL